MRNNVFSSAVLSKPKRCRTYLISPLKIPDVDKFAGVLEETFSGGDVACFQLDLYSAGDEEIKVAAAKLMPICRANKVLFLINQDPYLAREIGADGVHLGQHNLHCTQAREILGDDAIIGVTCNNSFDLGLAAAKEGASYVSFGPFYSSTILQGMERAELPLLEAWADGPAQVPSIANGGIKLENAIPLVEAGADFIALCSSVWKHDEGPKAAIEKFNSLIDCPSG